MNENDNQSFDRAAALEEYKELSENMRYYANSRFVHLTLFIALTGVLFSVIFSADSQTLLNKSIFDQPIFGIDINPLLSLKIFGIIITFVFYVFEQRAVDNWVSFLIRAKALEKNSLKYEQYSSKNRKPSWRTLWLRATWAARLFFFFVFVAWILLLFHMPPNP